MGKTECVFSRQVWTIAAKDLRSELRTKEAINASLAFSLVILVLFSFAFDPGNSEVNIQAVSGGLLVAGLLLRRGAIAQPQLRPRIAE